MIESADENLSAGGLLLEVALEAKHRIAFGKELGVDGAVGPMAGGAAFAQSFVFEDMGPALGRVTFEAGLAFGAEGRGASGFGRSLVGFVAVGTGKSVFPHGVAVRQAEVGPDIEVAVEADPGVLPGVQDLVEVAAAVAVEAAGAHRVWAGIGAYRLSGDQALRQIRDALESVPSVRRAVCFDMSALEDVDCEVLQERRPELQLALAVAPSLEAFLSLLAPK